MKVKVIKTFRDKITKSVLKPGQIIEVTGERFGELTGPFGIFVEEIKEGTSNLEGEPPASEDINFEKLSKAEIMEYAETIGLVLTMEMTKEKMIEELKVLINK